MPNTRVKPHISLKNKLLLAFLLIGIIPSLTLGFMLYKKSEQAVEVFVLEDIWGNLMDTSHEDELPIISIDRDSVRISLDSIDQNVLKDSIVMLEDSGVDNLYIEGIRAFDTDKSKGYKNIQTVQMDNLYGGLYNDSVNKRLLYYFTDVKKVNENVDDAGTLFIKFSLIIITLSIGASIAISYNITYGITRLLSYTKRVERGDLDFEIKGIANDEIGLLTRSFNKMIFRLNRLIDKTYRLELSESEAKLKALQAQISPHFLYNALDTINWSLIENGDYKTSATLGALSEILRYSIGDFEKIVTLEEEMKHVTNYLKVQQSRFEDRLSYHIDIEDELLKEALPKLLLQPIVENAVVHGVERNTQGGVIRVEGRLKEDRIEILVSDNGSGISAEKLKLLNEKFKDKNRIKSVDRTQHIGLVNVYERIQLIYGHKSGIVIKSRQGQGTEIVISLGQMIHQN